MSLARAIDAVGPIEPGIEPLRAIGSPHLHGEHVAELVEKRAGILLGREIAALPPPISPCPGQSIEHLAGIGPAAIALPLGERNQNRLVGNRPPQPRRDGALFDALRLRRYPGLAEIFLG